MFEAVVLIIFAFLVRVVSGPLTKRAMDSTRKMTEMQPIIKKIQRSCVAWAVGHFIWSFEGNSWFLMSEIPDNDERNKKINDKLIKIEHKDIFKIFCFNKF